MNKLEYVIIVLGFIVGVLFVIDLDLMKHNKIVEEGLNNIAVAIQTQNNILNYNPDEESRNE